MWLNEKKRDRGFEMASEEVCEAPLWTWLLCAFVMWTACCELGCVVVM